MHTPARDFKKPISRISKRKERFEPLNFAEEVRRRLSLAQWLFLTVVVIPTLMSGVYLGLIASNRYVSEAAFIVRGVSSQSAGGLTSLLRSFGLSRATDDTYVVQDFIGSREALHELNDRIPLRPLFSRADWFSRYPKFWRRDNAEALYDYYRQRVTLNYGSSTGITQLGVSGFRPEDAKNIAATLLHLSEELVNQMNARAQRDAIAYAESELNSSEAKVLASQAAITNFRNREMLIDPSSASAKSLSVVTGLTDDLARASAQLQETTVSAPSSPAIQTLRIRVRALQDQITVESAKMAGSDTALASKMSEYERLSLNREFADRELTLAYQALELARQEARRQHIYIETISAPNLPDDTTEPRRLRGFLTVFVFSLAIFTILWFFVVGAREQLHG